MPIEFNCQSCGRLMRTPDSAAGKKGKCPHCGAKMAIPLTSDPQASTPSDSARSSSAGATGHNAQGKADDDKIEFPCPKCSLPVRTPASVAGKKGKCPNCGEVVQIPAKTPEAPDTKDKPAAKIQFRCPGCQKMLRTPADVAGKKIKCPSCNAVLSVPSTGKQKGDGDAQPSTTPVLDESIGLAPLGDAPSLAPVDDAPQPDSPGRRAKSDAG